MRQYFKSQKSILRLIENATQKLRRPELALELDESLKLIGEIVHLLGRFDKLTDKERANAGYLCFKLNARVKAARLPTVRFVCESDSAVDIEAFRWHLKEMKEIFQISLDWLVEGIEFQLPARIESDWLDDFEAIMTACKTKTISFKLIPLELAPLISIMDNVLILSQTSRDFEASLFALQQGPVRGDQSLTFGAPLLAIPASNLTLKYMNSLYEAHGVTALFLSLFPEESNSFNSPFSSTGRNTL